MRLLWNTPVLKLFGTSEHQVNMVLCFQGIYKVARKRKMEGLRRWKVLYKKKPL